jgi:Ca2+-transporting ATPase
MGRRPSAAGESMVRRDQFRRLGTEAGILTTSAFGAGLYGAMRHGLNSPQARTMSFGSLVIAQLLHALTYRSSKRSVFEPGGLSSNSRLVGIIGGSLAAQLMAMLVPGVRNALGVAPIGMLDALAMLAGGVAPFLIGEARKIEGLQSELHALYFRKPELDRPQEVQASDGLAEGPKRRGPFEATRLPQRGAPKARSTSADARPSNSPRASRLERKPRRPIR